MVQVGAEVRQELREILSGLQAQIHADGARGLKLHRESACVAEISSIRNLLDLAYRALLGRSLPPDSSFLTLGQLRDCKDAASTTARDMKLQRDAAEARLQEPVCVVPADAAVNELIANECACLRAVDAHERQHAQMLVAALTTCAREIGDVVVEALCAAAPKDVATSERRRIAAEAIKKVQTAATSWLSWYQKNESRQAPIPEVHVQASLMTLMLGDAALSTRVQHIRQCMHLRRQQSRLVAVLARLSAADAVGDVTSALRSRIVLI